METENQPAEEAPEVSVEDRANALFADEPQAAPEAAPEAVETATETFDYEYEGERFTLPKRLEKAVMQERDYTQKTQSLAELRKDVERQFSQIKLAQSEKAFNDSVKAEREQIAMIDAVLAEYGKLEWAKFNTDELVRKKLEMDQYREMKTGLESKVSAARAQFDQAYSQDMERIKAEARETLTKRLSWNDEKDAEARAYARELGYSDAEYDAAYDPRAKQMAWEASQYRKLKAGAQPAVQQVKNVKANPSNPMSDRTKQKLNFQKQVAKTKPNSSERRHVVEGYAAKIFG